MLSFELHFCFLLLHIKQLCSEMVAYFFHPHSLSALIQVKSLTKDCHMTWVRSRQQESESVVQIVVIAVWRPRRCTAD